MRQRNFLILPGCYVLTGASDLADTSGVPTNPTIQRGPVYTTHEEAMTRMKSVKVCTSN